MLANVAIPPGSGATASSACTPATSCEAERAFSGCKYTISNHRSRLGEDILEALECDGAWLRAITVPHPKHSNEIWR